MQRLAADPTLVGALTVLVTIVAVFLAYNANNGLPFVPTYRVSAQVPDANALVKGNEVRVGGLRVGVVESIQPVQYDDGSVNAKLNLKLDKNVEPLPQDSTVVVRNKSSIGLKYLQLSPGKSSRGLAEGAILPLRAARPESGALDQFLNMFDSQTRAAIRLNEREFGSAIAGRGPDLNATIAVLPPLFRHLQPVMRNLASASTGLGRFFHALEATSSEVAPAADQQAHQWVALDTTFTALARVARPFIQQTITKGPRTEDTTIETMPQIRPFLRDSAALFSDLEPASRALITAAPQIAAATSSGSQVLPKTPALNAELAPTAQALVDFGATPGVDTGLQLLSQTNNVLDPTLQFITPAQTVCNYVSLLLRNGADISSLSDGIGTYQRFIALDPPSGPNNIGSPASAPANGPDLANHLHFNPYPNTAAPGQPRECEAGNEPYNAATTLIGSPPGNQGTVTEDQPKKKKKKKGSGG
jgi:virulence factor Mce-like protein